MRLFAGLLLLCAAASAAMAEPNVAGTGACNLDCEQKLAACQQKNQDRAQCSRKYQACRDGCQGGGKPRKDARPSKKEVCTQRCEFQANACREANPGASFCTGGRDQCLKRCEK